MESAGIVLQCCWVKNETAVSREGERGSRGQLEDRFFTIKCRQLLFHQVQFNCVLQEVGQSKQPGKQYKYKHILNIYILIYTIYTKTRMAIGHSWRIKFIRGLRSHAVYNFLGVAIVPEGIEINCT